MALADPKLRNFCQQIALGVSITAAGRLAGIKSPARAMKKPEVQGYLLSLQQEAEKKFEITRDDTIEGFKEAIEMAKLMGEPNAVIAGWREIAKVLGHYEPETKRLILSTEEENRRRQLGLMDEKLLLEMAGDPKVIDAEFDLVGTDD